MNRITELLRRRCVRIVPGQLTIVGSVNFNTWASFPPLPPIHTLPL